MSVPGYSQDPMPSPPLDTDEDYDESRDEILLAKNDRRFVLFPIRFSDIWTAYKKAEACFWTAEEVDLSGDKRDWANLTVAEREFIAVVLAFFAASDGIVFENLAANFSCEIQIPEARCFYGFQMAIENIHSEVYSLLIDTYYSNDEAKKQKLFTALETYPCVRMKAEWAMKYMRRTKNSFARRLVAFAIVEGVFFSASFCAIFWFKKRGLMPGLTLSNELISRDEGLHTDFACLLYNSHVSKKLSEVDFHDMMRSAVAVEETFVTDLLPSGLLGMNATSMIEYVKFCADRLCQVLGYTKMYNAKNPFDFMELISVDGKTNFFEKRVAEYAKPGVGVAREDMIFSKDADF